SVNYYQEYQRKSLIKEFDAKLQIANGLYHQSDQRTALIYIDSLRLLSQKNASVSSYAANLIEKEKDQIDIELSEGKYKEAIWGLLLYMQYFDEKEAKDLYKLAIAYKNTGDYQKSIYLFEKLLKGNYRELEALLELAQIYNHGLIQKELALKYYERGLEEIIEDFRSTYGKAYRLLINRENTPKLYSTFYREAAELYFELGDYDKARKTLTWVIFFEPDTQRGYELMIISLINLNEIKLACNYFSKAVKKGHEISIQKLECYD
ncbi:MAG: tetratricopeptide repeat protein, partial [Nitrososphaeraceae archaeon]|nr:tetratricopeptide repeat protein [Nitrososphaeraceae archaeon]